MFETFALFVLDTIKRYHRQFLKDRVLRTAEEVVANTNEDNLPSAVVVGELYNNLMCLNDNGQIENLHIGENGKPYITYKVGADAVTKKLGSNGLELLWENTSPSSQNTVNAYCNYSGYKYIAVVKGSAFYSKGNVLQILEVGKDTRLEDSLGGNYNRTVTYNSGFISFTTGNPNASGGNYGFPFRIYGVEDIDDLPFMGY